MRAHIIKRDKVCRICDGASYQRPRYSLSFPRRLWLESSREYVEYHAIEPEWHVDHINPCAEGGTDDPENLRLLCGKCHKRITKEWHGQRAAKRRESLPHTMAMQL
jgi:5-methylcytosine-specific restriction endonuclease McrA